MKYISEFEIKNFRGFDYLKLENLGKINVFFGKNNCGKSSILEGVFLTIGMANSMLPLSINNFRGLLPGNHTLKYLFNNLNIDRNIVFDMKFRNKTSRKLELISIREQSFIEKEESIYSTDISNNIIDLKLKFSKKGLKTRSETYETTINNLKINFKYKDNLNASYMNRSNFNNNQEIVKGYSKLLRGKKGDFVLKSLREIEPSILNIEVLDDGIYFDVSGVDELIPVNIFGDGIKQYLRFITSIPISNITLIDEIENGLHFSIQKTLWQSIINLSKEFNSQLFITTHSLETLKALKEVLEDEKNKDMRDEVKAINIVHTKKAGIKAYNYGFESLKEMIDTETEIR